MKVELDDVMYWMDAIRNSEDKYRTLESFWKGQLNSKVWLVDNLRKIQNEKWNDITIHGGWNGVLASLIFNSEIKVDKILSIDIDPECEKPARTVNKRYFREGRFAAITCDMCDFDYQADVVINTSCEHITQEQYVLWLSKQSKNSIIVLQSNDYFDHEEHVRCSKDVDQFIDQSGIIPLFADKLKTKKYDRFMIIGKKCE
jgi:hypothetical protein